MAPAGAYAVTLSTDDEEFGDQGRIDHETRFLTQPQGETQFIKTYVPARTAVIFRKID